MKTDNHNAPCQSAEITTAFCQKIVAALVQLKKQLQAKYEALIPGRRELVRDLIAEAEVLAWQTSFPHLFLPDLAEARLAEVLANGEPAFARVA